MQPVTYNYVCLSAGPHQRQPTRTGFAGGFTLIKSSPGGTVSPGDTFKAPPQQQIQSFGTPLQTYYFSFLTITGCSLTPGGPLAGITGYSYENTPAAAYVGEYPINVLLVYVPEGGGIGKGSGATIDSFDETAGALFNDTFVTVTPDPSGELTQYANVDGYVDTTNSSEEIIALSPTSPTDVIFSRWVGLGPPAFTLTSAPVLEASQGVPVFAFAFYDAPPVVGTLVVKVFEDTTGGMYPALATVTAYPGGLLQETQAGVYTLAASPGVIKVTATGGGFHATPKEEGTTVTIVAGQTTTVEFIFVEKGTQS